MSGTLKREAKGRVQCSGWRRVGIQCCGAAHDLGFGMKVRAHQHAVRHLEAEHPVDGGPPMPKHLIQLLGLQPGP